MISIFRIKKEAEERVFYYFFSGLNLDVIWYFKDPKFNLEILFTYKNVAIKLFNYTILTF